MHPRLCIVCDLADENVLGLKWVQDGNVSRVFYLAKGDRFSEFKVIDDVKHSTYSPVPITESQEIAKNLYQAHRAL